MAKKSSDYQADKIKVLEGLEAVRKRPAMYIGSTHADGLHHLVYEVVDNSVDEAMAGLHQDKSHHPRRSTRERGLTTAAASRWISTPPKGIPAVQVVMTKLHAGGKFDDKAYKVAGGLHGVGVSVVNALSEWLEVEIPATARFIPSAMPRVSRSMNSPRSASPRRPAPRSSSRPTPRYSRPPTIHLRGAVRRLRELSFLEPGLEITLIDERQEKDVTYLYKGGISEFVEYL
jgi:DNA gyrase subunit B